MTLHTVECKQIQYIVLAMPTIKAPGIDQIPLGVSKDSLPRSCYPTNTGVNYQGIICDGKFLHFAMMACGNVVLWLLSFVLFSTFNTTESTLRQDKRFGINNIIKINTILTKITLQLF